MPEHTLHSDSIRHQGFDEQSATGAQTRDAVGLHGSQGSEPPVEAGCGDISSIPDRTYIEDRTGLNGLTDHLTDSTERRDVLFVCFTFWLLFDIVSRNLLSPEGVLDRSKAKKHS